MNYYGTSGEKYLAHHGILGMKWGVRRFQNDDGTWTSAGLRRRRENYDSNEGSFLKKHGKTIAKVALAAATVAGAAYLYSRHKGAIASVVKEAAKETVKSVVEETAVNSGKEFVEFIKIPEVSKTKVDRTEALKVDISRNNASKTSSAKSKSKINLTFDAKYNPNDDIASKFENLRSEVSRQSGAVNGSPNMQQYVDELLRKK